MNHAIFQPSRTLEDLVDFYWVSHDYYPETARESVLPSGAFSLVIDLADGCFGVFDDDRMTPVTRSRAVMCGARARPLVVGMPARVSAVGVCFKPAGVLPFLGAPAAAVGEGILPLDDLWGRSAHTLRERMMEATTPAARVALLEAQLLSRARLSLAPSPALRAAVAAFDDLEITSVGEVGRRMSVSPKRLLALFREHVGLSPKAFWRVRRFRAALDRLERGRVSGAALAAEYGYYDQAHLIREFRVLAGACPREYLATRIPGTGHTALRG